MLRTSDAIVVAAVGGTGAVGAVVDCWIRRVPNALTGAIAILGLALAAWHVDDLGVPGSLAGLAVGLALMLPPYLVGATGGGDVKLFAAIGTLLGPRGAVAAFFYTVIAGGVLALIVAASRHRLRYTFDRLATFVSTGGSNVAEIEDRRSDNRFAYAPAIAIGALVAALGI